jgi:Spy/CpxP family protein refolding chaperone
MLKPALIATALIAIAAPSLAQPTPPPASRAERHERWHNATPEQRAEMEQRRQELRQRFQNATPEERAQMRERMRADGRGPAINPNATPEERAQLQERLRQRFAELPLEQQQRILEHRGRMGHHGRGPHRGAPAVPPAADR